MDNNLQAMHSIDAKDGGCKMFRYLGGAYNFISLSHEIYFRVYISQRYKLEI